ncbi:MAG: PHP domain-containing protein [Anaerolineae bacterium]
MIDMHTHTCYSDGRASPAELIEAASALGLSALAITDHDTLRGSIEAPPHAQRAGIELVPAVEITTQWGGVSHDVDILGYFVDVPDTVLNAVLQTNLAALHSRVADVCERLQRQGLSVTLEDVHRQNPLAISYLSVIHVLLDKGYAAGFAQADALFREALGAQSFGVPTEDAIAAVRHAGGVPVLAHPVYVRPGFPLTAVDLAPLVEAGLQGIECWHPRLTADDSTHYSALARSLGLAISGGSDEHGWPTGFPALGTQIVTEDMLEDLRGRADPRRSL